MTFCGIWGRPYIDLAPVLDTAPLAELDEEITLGLSGVATSFTGGSLKWMGVVAPPVQAEPGYADAMHVIARFSRDEFARFASLADDPAEFDVDRRHEYAFGDETDHPLSKRQMMYLEYRHGVYFPWKVAYHLLENVLWEDKNRGSGKTFRREARQVFPRTVEYIRALPFREIGRVVLFGLESKDHAPLHRDTVPRYGAEIEHCITLCPRGDKRFFLADPDLTTRVYVETPLYWFNDMDWHGVEPDPYFRYSIRVDGVFEPAFLRSLQDHVRGTSSDSKPPRLIYNGKPMSDERRTAHRVRLTGVRVTYESAAGESVEADAVDLGQGGVFVRTAAPLVVGKRISLEIHVVGEPGPWSALGRVVWTREKGEGEKAPPGMAVKFIDADEAVISAIERLVETRERTEPGVGKPSTPPPNPAPVVVVAPERERTLMGVGIAPEEPAPPRPPPREPSLAREQSVAIDLVSKKSEPPAPPERPVEPQKGGGAGRLIVVLLLLVVAGVAAYVLLDGFLRPPGR